jgi:hypothetical protein
MVAVTMGDQDMADALAPRRLRDCRKMRLVGGPGSMTATLPRPTM